MSKVIKQMEMSSLAQSFQGVRDLVVLSVKGLSGQADHGLRMALRKKNIRLQVVKNSLTRRVFHEMGLRIADDSPYWLGPTTMAWGTESAGELGRAIDAELKNPKLAAAYKDKVAIKGGIVDGQAIDFNTMKAMPTRAEAIAGVLAAIMGPYNAIVGCLTSPGGQVAGQIQSIAEKAEKKEEAAPAAPA
jgi:large subunit ribosomal protein L10